MLKWALTTHWAHAQCIPHSLIWIGGWEVPRFVLTQYSIDPSSLLPFERKVTYELHAPISRRDICNLPCFCALQDSVARASLGYRDPKAVYFHASHIGYFGCFFFWLAFLTAVGDGDQSLSHLNLESLTGIAAGNQSSIEGCSLLLFESFIICLSSVSPIFLQEPSMSPYSQKNKSFMLDGTHEEGGYPLHSFL